MACGSTRRTCGISICSRRAASFLPPTPRACCAGSATRRSAPAPASSTALASSAPRATAIASRSAASTLRPVSCSARTARARPSQDVSGLAAVGAFSWASRPSWSRWPDSMRASCTVSSTAVWHLAIWPGWRQARRRRKSASRVSGGRRPDLAAFLARTEPLFGFTGARVIERRAGRIPAGGRVEPWSAPGVLLVGDAAGMVSPATGGGIRLAFQFGRGAAQAIADHLLHLGPPPATALVRELPRFGLKRALRAGLDLAPPNFLVDAFIATSPMRWLATHAYFHRRGAKGLSFAEFEARLRAAGEGARGEPRGRLGAAT